MSRRSTAGTTAGCVALIGLALSACKVPTELSASSGDVVVATSYSRYDDTHSVVCAANPASRLGDYQVTVDAATANQVRHGDPCPEGPREPTDVEQYPKLYETLREGLYGPMPYEGGNPATCGTWGTVDPDEARRLLAECPPLTRGDL